MCLPGGAIVSSTLVAIVISRIGSLARPAVLRVVVGAFEVVERRADVHRAVVVRADAVAGQAR